jgi:hypothetical protein
MHDHQSIIVTSSKTTLKDDLIEEEIDRLQTYQYNHTITLDILINLVPN